MKVTVRGQTIESFRILIEDEKSSHEYDISQELVVDDAALDQETRDAAAKEHFWNQIAIEAEKEFEEFDKTWYAVYRAHLDRFARYYLKAQGDRAPSGTAKDKAAAFIFSENTEKDASVHVAYQAYTDEMEKIGITPVAAADFEEEMFKYEDSIEGIERIRISLEHKVKQLKAVSSAFNTKSWSIKTLAADRRAMIGANL